MKRITLSALFVTLFLAQAALAAAPPTHLWSQSFGGTTTDVPQDVAIDGAGNIYITGYFNGTTDLGGGPLVSAGLDDGFIAKYDASGVHLWSRRFGTTSYDGGAGIAVDPAGNILVTGVAATNILIRKYDAAGTQLWAKQVGGSSWDEGAGVATDAAGNVFVNGYFTGAVNFGGSTLFTDPPETSDMFVVKFDPLGNHLWSKSFDCGSANLATDASGSVTISGGFTGSVDFGGGPLLASGPADAFLVRFDPAGGHVWSKRFGGTSGEYGWDVDCDAAGNVVLAAVFAGITDFGGGPVASAGNNDVVVARYDASGAYQWSTHYGGIENETVYDVDLDAQGNAIVTGGFRNVVDFGGGPVASAGSYDIYITKFDLTGNHQWTIRGGDVDHDEGAAVAVDDLGGIVATGNFQLSADFGGGPLGNAGGLDVFLASFFDEPPVPVRISSFDARLRGRDVELTWDVWSDEDLESYVVHRRAAGEPEVAIVRGVFGAGTRSYTDTQTEAGETYRYELLLQTTSGAEVRSQPVTITVPRFSTSLAQNSPNPFHQGTVIEYTLGEGMRAVVGIYDAAGRLVLRLDSGERDAGTYRTEWNGRDSSGALVGSGVYFYRLEGVKDTAPRKMIVIR